MTSDLIFSFGRMFPDYSHPVLVRSAEESAEAVTPSQELMTRSVPFAEVQNFVAEFYQTTEARTSSRSFPLLGSSGLMEHGHFLTLSSLALHSADSAFLVCSLAEILEPVVARKYFLSAKGCSGILRRAEARKRELPPRLEAVLRMVASTDRDAAAKMT